MPASVSVGQRISQLIQQLGMSKNAFAISLDKTATVIQHLVDERNKPGFDLMNKVLEVYPNVSADWLLRGHGAMMRNTTDTPDASEVVPAAAPTAAARPVPVEVAAAATPSFPAPLFAVSAARAATPAPTAEAELPAAMPQAPAPPSAQHAPAAASEPALPAAAAAPIASPVAAATAGATLDAATLTAALHTQHLQHQLALAEQRNQHLLEQQKLILERQALMQQMLDFMRRPA